MINQATPAKITDAAGLLKSGQLVAFPTETVYGLGADATNPAAVASIYAAKGRPSFNPLISHFASVAQMFDHVMADDRARHLATLFMPGPLSLVLPRKTTSPICDLACAGLPTIAVRVPSHPVAQALLSACGGLPIAAPSANLSGRLSPTTPVHVANSLQDSPAMILAAGAAPIGLESTVLDLSNAQPVLLRHGAITRDMLENALGTPILTHTDNASAPTSPGQLLQHYAPTCLVRLNAVDVVMGEALLAFGSTKFMAVRGMGPLSLLPDTHIRNLSPDHDLTEAASKLFAYLHDLQAVAPSAIAVMPIPSDGIGAAIIDRLTRAAK